MVGMTGNVFFRPGAFNINPLALMPDYPDDLNSAVRNRGKAGVKSKDVLVKFASHQPFELTITAFSDSPSLEVSVEKRSTRGKEMIKQTGELFYSAPYDLVSVQSELACRISLDHIRGQLNITEKELESLFFRGRRHAKRSKRRAVLAHCLSQILYLLGGEKVQGGKVRGIMGIDKSAERRDYVSIQRMSRQEARITKQGCDWSSTGLDLESPNLIETYFLFGGVLVCLNIDPKNRQRGHLSLTQELKQAPLSFSRGFNPFVVKTAQTAQKLIEGVRS